MNKKKNRISARQAAEKAVIRDAQNRRLEYAATTPIPEVLQNLHTTLSGLDPEGVTVSRSQYGSNKVTREKKKSLARRLAEAFINPFTAILCFLAVVSTMTDMVFPFFSLFGSVPEDFDCLTVVIILTMVMISGTLRFVQESRSGNAAEKLLAMITTTCTVTRKNQEKGEIPMGELVVGDIAHLSAGDMIPGDVRILEAKDLFISQSSLTGESEPIEKTPFVSDRRDSITDYSNMLSICTYAEWGGEVHPLTENVRCQILETVAELNDKGFRVLAVAQKSNPSPVGTFGVRDEREMVLLGYLAFLDPPKESTAEAIQALKAHGVTTKILTGDNEKVTRTICKQVGLKVRNMLLGSDIEKLNDAELGKAAETTDVFAKLTPDQKARVVSVLRERGHIVGFMGDGINDTAAMKAADIGISVDTAVDVAKESADIILLEKDLMVLEQGIIEGRKTYANMIKYIKMTASSNFGNMFSVLAASALLPFLPMMSLHLILLNLIYDLSCTAIPWDNVDEEFIAKPRKWDASSVGSFMIWLGPTSSIFDFTTYLFMYFVFCPLFVSGGVLFNDLPAHFSGAELAAIQAKYIGLFQAGWFVESMWSQTLVIHMIRTPRLPFLQSHASAPLTLLTLTGIAVLTVIPFTPLGAMLGFVALPGAYFAYLIPCILLYMVLATSLKKAYVRHYGELL